MKGRRYAAAVLTLILCTVFWVVAQTQAPASLAAIFPGGAMLFLEVKDLRAVMSDWDRSEEKKLWLASDNYQVFSRTRLITRLQDVQNEFTEVAGFLPEMTFANSIAGTQSALAVYDIGNLEFLYVSRLELSQAARSALFQQQANFQRRNSAGHDFFVKSGPRTVAFASADGLFLLATRESLLANALALLARRETPALTGEAWYQRTVADPRPQGEIRMALNLPALLQSPHFRSYWIHRNASQIQPFSSGLVDLYRESGIMREERTFLRESAGESLVPAEAAVKQVTALAPEDAGFYRSWARPTPGELEDLIRSKLIAPGPQTSQDIQIAAPAINADIRAGDPGDLETRIDQPPLEPEQSGTRITAIRQSLEGRTIEAAMLVQNSRVGSDGVFIGSETAIVLLAAADWRPVALAGVQVHRAGRVLVLSDSPELLKRVAARIGSAPAPASGNYLARYNHARELDPFRRMMTLMDSNPGEGTNFGSEGTPEFFSRNVASLGQSLRRLQSASVTSRDEGSAVRQQVLYRLQ